MTEQAPEVIYSRKRESNLSAIGIMWYIVTKWIKRRLKNISEAAEWKDKKATGGRKRREFFQLKKTIFLKAEYKK